MGLILNIDTSLESATLSLAEKGRILSKSVNQNQKDHAAFLHTAIMEMLSQAGISVKDLDAIAVTEGPGSYTGLRVGMATAKGLCFAADKPFITVPTLEAMTVSVKAINNSASLYVPMIDARRMEVFTAVYNSQVELILQPCPMIVDKDSFSTLLSNSQMLFFGSGSQKLKSILDHSNAIFTTLTSIENGVAEISWKKYYDNNFTELVNSEPLYLKAFQDSR